MQGLRQTLIDILRQPCRANQGGCIMKCPCSLLTLVLLAAPGLAQEAPRPAAQFGAPVTIVNDTDDHVPVVDFGTESGNRGQFLSSDRGFPHMIGYVSNPTFAIDPRSLTEICPIFGNVWMPGGFGPLKGGDVQVYGPVVSVAVNERLSFGLNQGAYAVSDFHKERDGWLDLGGFFQYALIRDVPGQFLLTTGLRWEAPTGSSDVFQGTGPAYLAPYATVAKEFGDFHVLNTVGFQFAIGPGDATPPTFYGTLHFDRCFFGWLYPLVEFNWAALTGDVNVNLPTLRGLIDYSSFSSTGAILTVAPGLNVVLVPDHVELGGVYQTPLDSEHHLHFSELLVKLVLRY
jgi:hypothetical protein